MSSSYKRDVLGTTNMTQTPRMLNSSSDRNGTFSHRWWSSLSLPLHHWGILMENWVLILHPELLVLKPLIHRIFHQQHCLHQEQ